MASTRGFLILGRFADEPVECNAESRSRVFQLLFKLQPAKAFVCVLHRRTPFKDETRRSLSNPLFKRARFPGREDDGKLLNKAFPLADHGCAILLFLGEFRRNLFAFPCRDVARFARAKNSVDETRASDEAHLARMQRCEWPSSNNCWFRGENSRGLPVGRRVRNEILQFVERQALERQCCRPAGRHGVWVARVCQLWQALVLAS